MMKIAIVGIRGLPANYGGFETCAEHTSKYWVKKGNEVLVYCRKSHYVVKPEQVEGAKLIYIPSISIKGIDTLTHTLFSIFHLVLFRPDYKFVHLYNSGNGIFIPLLKLFRKKVITSVDGIEWKRKKWGIIARRFHKFGALCTTKFSDRIICDNKEVQIIYERLFKIKTIIIEYGAKFIDRDSFSGRYLNKYNLESGKYFIFVGRFVPEKGVHHLIEAYLKLKTKKPLILIGDDTSETKYKIDLFQQGERYTNIIMPGFLYNDEYEELLSNAYLYLSASELEGTSPSLLAAMGARTCTLVQGIDENLETVGNAGFTFVKTNYTDLLKKWQFCEDNPKLVEKMALKGFKHVQKNYQWSNIAEKYIKLFSELI